MRKVTAGPFHSVDGVFEAPNRAVGIAAAIAAALLPGHCRNRHLLDPANFPDRLKHDIGLPPGLVGPPDRHWSDYR